MERHYQIEGTVSVGAYVKPELKRSLVRLAYARGEKVSEVLRQAISEKVERESPREGTAGAGGQ